MARVGEAHSLHLDTVPAAHLVHDDVVLLLVLESGVLEVRAHFPLQGRALNDHVADQPDLQRAFEGRVLESEDNRMDGKLHRPLPCPHSRRWKGCCDYSWKGGNVSVCDVCVCASTCVHVCACVCVYVCMCVGEL